MDNMTLGRNLASTPLYKALNPNLVHRNNFRWQLGENYSATGLYFGTLEQVLFFVRGTTLEEIDEQLIGTVSLKDDEQVTVKFMYFRCPCVTLTDIRKIKDLPAEVRNEIVDILCRRKPQLILSLPRDMQTPQRLMASMARTLKHVVDMGHVPDEETCLNAVKKRGLELEWVQNQTHAICLAAVTKEPCSVIYVKEPVVKNRKFWLEAIEATQGRVYWYMHKTRCGVDILADQELARRAILWDPRNFYHVNPLYMTKELVKFRNNVVDVKARLAGIKK